MRNDTLTSPPIGYSSDDQPSLCSPVATRRADRKPGAASRTARIKIPALGGAKRLLTFAMLVAWTSALAAGERDVVKPLIGDKLIAVRLTHREMAGGEIDRRVMDLIGKNFMVLDLDRDWLD